MNAPIVAMYYASYFEYRYLNIEFLVLKSGSKADFLICLSVPLALSKMVEQNFLLKLI